MELHLIITLFLSFFVQLESTPSYRFDKNRDATGNRIYYKIDKLFRPEEKSYIMDRMKEIQSKTCLVWKELKAEWPKVRKWVEFERVEEPHSCATLQRRENATKIYLAPHCFQDKRVVQKMLHSLGFEHEHQRREVHSSKLTNHDYAIDKKANKSIPDDLQIMVIPIRKGPFMKPEEDMSMATGST